MELTVNQCSIWKFVDGWIWTADLWYWKQLLCQLSHSRCPGLRSYRDHNLLFLKKMGQPRPLFHLFSVFSNKHHYNFYNRYMWKKCPSSIRCRDSNPWPSERESLPFTTRPGLPPVSEGLFKQHFLTCTREYNSTNILFWRKYFTTVLAADSEMEQKVLSWSSLV